MYTAEDPSLLFLPNINQSIDYQGIFLSHTINISLERNSIGLKIIPNYISNLFLCFTMSRKKLVMLGNIHKMFLENPYSDYMSMSFIVNISYSGKEQRYSEFTRIKYSFYHYTIIHTTQFIHGCVLWFLHDYSNRNIWKYNSKLVTN